MTQPPIGTGFLRGLSSSVFGGLADSAFRGLESELATVRLRAGETLFTAGEPGDALYVVGYGRLRAFIPDLTGGQRILGEIGRGESVGEMALLTGEPRSATVCAVRDTQLVKLSKAGFDRLSEHQPQLMLEVARLIIARYQRVIGPEKKARPATIAVVPCQANVPALQVAMNLQHTLAPEGRVRCLDAAGVQRDRGAPADRWAADLEGSDLAGWLHEQELQHEYLIYVADPAASPWTRLCVRQADLVLVVGLSGGSRTIEPGVLDAIVAHGRAGGARRELILLFDSSRASPSGTTHWLANVPVSAHHHVDLNRPRDFARVARLITGRSTGLVLGGGGARGLAHIGVIRALEEAGIDIDMVGGTSSGSIIGGQYASGWDSARIMAESRRVLVEGGSLNDFTLPVIALLRGNRYIRMLEKLFGDRLIEDLPLSFFCIATNLTLSTCLVQQSGLLRKEISASCAVPGLGPPIVSGQDLLVDGGVVNNLPVDVMRNLGARCVFASSVSPRTALGLPPELSAIPSPWKVIRTWLNPFAKPLQVPSIMNILMRTASLHQPSAGVPADVLIEPAGGDWKLLDWAALDRIVESGYRAAVPALEAWQSRQRAGSAE